MRIKVSQLRKIIKETFEKVSDDRMLSLKAKAIWAAAKRGDEISNEDVDTMKLAYHANVLPKDPEYNVYEWVEEDCPSF